ncbi:PqiC family protein [Thioclava sp. GXIMD4216]|uniref:PqiC family protein n=1 Tax=Thioclava litoralis TaxID=3076557 RepID=A0ABZ1DX70_9RHOB|nr:PqiC family protein [Thioclava sp. FTW29]
MMIRFTTFSLIGAALVTLAACSDPLDTAQYAIDPAPAKDTLPNRLGRAELREISLPDYASGQEIAFQTPDGALRSSPDNIWADDPKRAMTLALARQISEMSGATVIAEPWPLASDPQRKIEVRVDRFLAAADGAVHLDGVYYVSPASYAASGGDTVRRFDITVPMGGVAGKAADPGLIARTQSAALGQLAAQIAQMK